MLLLGSCDVDSWLIVVAVPLRILYIAVCVTDTEVVPFFPCIYNILGGRVCKGSGWHIFMLMHLLR